MYHTQTIECKNDYEGKVIATLIRKPGAVKSAKAVLYIHGFVDYFFQDHLADWYAHKGINFYALDLRKYGRSTLPHQHPNGVRDLSEYFEEIDSAVKIICNDDNNNFLILNGHSTGGLIAAVYSAYGNQRNKINAIFLNSPFLSFNANFLVRNIVVPVIIFFDIFFADYITPFHISPLYGESLHKNFKGKWNYNLKWKPIKGFPIKSGWFKAIHKGQRLIRKGLKPDIPVLVLCSDKSYKGRRWSDKLHTSDGVLNVKHIKKLSKHLGAKTTFATVEHARHDLFLSREEAIKMAYDKLSAWIKSLEQ